MLEFWNDGTMGFGMMVKSIFKNKIDIPSFHHSFPLANLEDYNKLSVLF